MQFRPSRVTTVGSSIQLYCNASTVGLNNAKGTRWTLDIHDKKGKLNSCETKKETIECTYDIQNVTHADAKLYLCVAKLLGGCSYKNTTLSVKGKFIDENENFVGYTMYLLIIFLSFRPATPAVFRVVRLNYRFALQDDVRKQIRENRNVEASNNATRRKTTHCDIWPHFFRN